MLLFFLKFEYCYFLTFRAISDTENLFGSRQIPMLKIFLVHENEFEISKTISRRKTLKNYDLNSKNEKNQYKSKKTRLCFEKK